MILYSFQIKTNSTQQIHWPSFMHVYNPRQRVSSKMADKTDSSAENDQTNALEDFMGVSSLDNNTEFVNQTTLASSLPTVSWANGEIGMESTQEPLLRPKKTSFALSGGGGGGGVPEVSEAVFVDLRKVWQKLLKICQAADVRRIGVVSRQTFLEAMSQPMISKVCR